MNNIKKIIREALKEVCSNILHESSTKFAARLSPEQIAEGDKIYNNIISKGKLSNFNIDYVDYAGSKGKGTATGNIFDYVIEKCIETYKTTNNETERNNILEALKFAYMIPPQAMSAVLLIILRRAGVPVENINDQEEGEKIRDMVKDVYIKLIATQMPKLLDYYTDTESGSFTGFMITTYANGLHDLYYKYKDFETKISLDQPVGASDEDDRTMADFIPGDEEKEYGKDVVKNFKKGTLEVINFLKEKNKPIIAAILYEITILGSSPEEIVNLPNFRYENMPNPYFEKEPNKITQEFTNFKNSNLTPIINKIYMKHGFSETISTAKGLKEIPTIDVYNWSAKDFYNPSKALSTKHISGKESDTAKLSLDDAEALSAYNLSADDYLEAKQKSSSIRNVYDYIRMLKGTTKKSKTTQQNSTQSTPEQGTNLAESYNKIKNLEILQEINLRRVLNKIIK